MKVCFLKRFYGIIYTERNVKIYDIPLEVDINEKVST